MSSTTNPPARRDPAAGPPLGYLLRQASARHRLAMERALSDLDVTPPQFLVLRMLREHPGSSNAELARRAMLSTPTLTVIVGNLVRRGAVTSRPHAVHGRVRPLDLSPAGSELLAQCEARAGTVEADLEVGLTAQDRSVIVGWLLRSASQ